MTEKSAISDDCFLKNGFEADNLANLGLCACGTHSDGLFNSARAKWKYLAGYEAHKGNNTSHALLGDNI
jgi:hypothetical protein